MCGNTGTGIIGLAEWQAEIEMRLDETERLDTLICGRPGHQLEQTRGINVK